MTKVYFSPSNLKVHCHWWYELRFGPDPQAVPVFCPLVDAQHPHAPIFGLILLIPRNSHILTIISYLSFCNHSCKQT